MKGGGVTHYLGKGSFLCLISICPENCRIHATLQLICIGDFSVVHILKALPALMSQG